MIHLPSGQLPLVILLIFIIAIWAIYTRIVTKQTVQGKSYKQLSNKRRKKLALSIGLPTLLLGGPALEEIVFRLPLILFFQDLNAAAWYTIGISSIIFGMTHHKIGVRTADKILNTDTVREHMKVLSSKDQRQAQRFVQIGMKMQVVLQTTLLGVIFGFFAVETQSILIPFIMHVVWNFLVFFRRVKYVPFLTWIIYLAIFIYFLSKN